MPVEIKVTMRDETVKRALKDPDMVAGPVRDWLRKSALLIEGKAKEFAPVDTGRLRNSIASRFGRLSAEVATGVKYAPYVELGTKPHWPPLAALQPWARRHGFPPGRAGAFLVARRIAQRGTKGAFFMLRAARDKEREIVALLGAAAREIERRWGRHG